MSNISEEDMKIKYAIYLCGNVFMEPDDFIDFYPLSYEDFRKQFVADNDYM